MNRLLIISSFLLLSFVSKAGNQALLDSAEVYYAANKYEEAIAAYEEVLASDFESVELYYNIGNAYYKSNKMAMAIVNYERALKLDSDNEDVLFNLEMANSHTIDKIEKVPTFFLNNWVDVVTGIFSSNQWAWISVIGFLLALAGLLIFFFSSKTASRRWAFWIAMAFLVVSFFSFNFSGKLKHQAIKEPEAIVLTPSVVVKSEPRENGNELFLIHEGLKVKVINTHNDWSRIELSDGNTGWLKRSDLVII